MSLTPRVIETRTTKYRPGLPVWLSALVCLCVVLLVSSCSSSPHKVATAKKENVRAKTLVTKDRAKYVSMLLSATDLPPGWTSHPPKKTISVVTSGVLRLPACIEHLDAVETSLPGIQDTFTTKATGGSVESEVQPAKSTNAARTYISRLSHAFLTCKGKTAGPKSGVGVSASRASAPGVPPSSSVFSFTVTSTGTVGRSLFDVGQVGSVVWTVAVTSSGTPSPTLLGHLAQDVTGKVHAA